MDNVEPYCLTPPQVIQLVELLKLWMVLADKRRPAAKLGGFRLRLLDEEAVGIGRGSAWTLLANSYDSAPRLIIGPWCDNGSLTARLK